MFGEDILGLIGNHCTIVYLFTYAIILSVFIPFPFTSFLDLVDYFPHG